MPKETIITPDEPYEIRTGSPDALDGPTMTVIPFGLSVGWTKGQWVQVYAIPHGAESTGDWSIIDLDAESIDHLIRTLKRARRQVFA